MSPPQPLSLRRSVSQDVLTRYDILPYERFTITTRLAPEEVVEVLTRVVEPKRSALPLRRYRGDKEFEGEFGGFTFRMRRIINYRNDFLPVIRGTIASASKGSVVIFTLQLRRPILMFMAAWFVVLTILVIAALLTFVLSREDFVANPALLFPLMLAFYAFGYGLMTGAFKYESRKARSRLHALLQAESTQGN